MGVPSSTDYSNESAQKANTEAPALMDGVAAEEIPAGEKIKFNPATGAVRLAPKEGQAANG